MLLTAAPGAVARHEHDVAVPVVRRGAVEAVRRPYGTWPVWLMVADKRWLGQADPDLDVAFAAVQVMRGHRIADVVGANVLLTNREPGGRVVVAGYPAKEND